jgi:hypothetical protein
MKLKFFLVAALLLICIGPYDGALAHELQPGTLEIRQLTTERYELAWRAPVYYGKPHPATLQLPDTWKTIGEPTVRQLSDSHLYRRIIAVPGGKIDGSVIRFDGLEATITDVFVRIAWLDGSKFRGNDRPGKWPVTLPGSVSIISFQGTTILHSFSRCC